MLHLDQATAHWKVNPINASWIQPILIPLFISSSSSQLQKGRRLEMTSSPIIAGCPERPNQNLELGGYIGALTFDEKTESYRKNTCISSCARELYNNKHYKHDCQNHQALEKDSS